MLGYLPEDLKDQVLATLRASWQLGAEKGKARLEKLAKWFEHEYPSAAESVREGLDEMFTISELKLPTSLRRCLGSTNIIESCFSGTRGRTRRVTHWQSGEMVKRWAASALLATEKNFRRILGYDYLPILKAKLDELAGDGEIDTKEKAS